MHSIKIVFNVIQDKVLATENTTSKTVDIAIDGQTMLSTDFDSITDSYKSIIDASF